jgi:formylglycine-generating enzyme required for sulfatase activity
MMAWLNALSELTGRAPVYYSTTLLMDGSHPIFKDALGAGITEGLTVYGESANGYRLPDRNQWEFAARWQCADSSGGLHWNPASYASGAAGNSASYASAVAWFSENSQKTQPVARKAANGLGFYDMSGNVWEVINGYPWKTTFSGGSFSCGTSLISVSGNYKIGSDDYRVTIDGTDKGFHFVRP